jgi:hypothetical protein
MANRSPQDDTVLQCGDTVLSGTLEALAMAETAAGPAALKQLTKVDGFQI